MTLSQEILVLDFGDEKQSEFLKNDASIDFNEAGKKSERIIGREEPIEVRWQCFPD